MRFGGVRVWRVWIREIQKVTLRHHTLQHIPEPRGPVTGAQTLQLRARARRRRVWARAQGPGARGGEEAWGDEE